MLKYIYSCDQIFSIITWSFRNHFNILICCLRNICFIMIYVENSCLIFLWKQCSIFFRILWWIERLKEQHLFKIDFSFGNINLSICLSLSSWVCLFVYLFLTYYILCKFFNVSCFMHFSMVHVFSHWNKSIM